VVYGNLDISTNWSLKKKSVSTTTPSLFPVETRKGEASSKQTSLQTRSGRLFTNEHSGAVFTDITAPAENKVDVASAIGTKIGAPFVLISLEGMTNRLPATKNLVVVPRHDLNLDSVRLLLIQMRWDDNFEGTSNTNKENSW
jgi:hypothetical protein